MSAQHSAGIQTLLDAEREASKIVDKAKEYRTKRVRQTREEARKESENYRQTTEKTFKAREGEHTQSNADAEKDALKDAEGEMNDLREQGDKNKALAISGLLEGVRDAVAAPPRTI